MEIRNIEFSKTVWQESYSVEIKIFFSFHKEPVIFRLSVGDSARSVLIKLINLIKDIVYLEDKE